jgi:hypothetical protein
VDARTELLKTGYTRRVKSRRIVLGRSRGVSLGKETKAPTARACHSVLGTGRKIMIDRVNYAGVCSDEAENELLQQT